MNLANFGAVRRLLLVSAVLTLSAVPVTAQIVERSQTWANLIQSHPCNAGLNGRHTILTDAQSSSSIGGGGGSVRVFVECDGVDTWSIVSIGGSGGGVSGLTTADGGTALADNTIVRGDGTTGIQGSTVTVADSTGNLQWEGTTADAFEGNFTFADPTADWTWAWGADGTLTGATRFNLENLRLDGNTISSTDTNGAINLIPNGTGQVTIPDGSQAAPGIAFGSDLDVGIYRSAANTLDITAGNTRLAQFDFNAFYPYRGVVGAGDKPINGFKAAVTASTAGSGAPKVLVNYDLGATWTNEGASAQAYFTLPTAVTGYQVEFCVQDSDGLRVTASAGDTIRRVASVTATAGYIVSTTIGSCVTLRAINATEWFVVESNDIATDSWTFN